MFSAFNYKIAAREEAGFILAMQAEDAAGCFHRDTGRKPHVCPVRASHRGVLHARAASHLMEISRDAARVAESPQIG